jgi:hypothetical protein
VSKPLLPINYIVISLGYNYDKTNVAICNWIVAK